MKLDHALELQDEEQFGATTTIHSTVHFCPLPVRLYVPEPLTAASSAAHHRLIATNSIQELCQV